MGFYFVPSMTVCVGGEKSYMPEFLHIYSTGLVISVKLGKLEIRTSSSATGCDCCSFEQKAGGLSSHNLQAAGKDLGLLAKSPCVTFLIKK